VFSAAHGGHTAIELEDWKCAVFGRSWVPFPIRKTDIVTTGEELLCPYMESVRPYVYLEKKPVSGSTQSCRVVSK